jgi:hypothetical protein
MHWFWRATIAAAAGMVVGFLIVFITPSFFSGGLIGTCMILSGIFASYFLSATVAMRLMPVRAIDNETRCRKCNYILRGITEPRCPECGERI